MELPNKNLISLEEFHKLRESTNRLLEYIDGAVFMVPSPSTRHQRISSRLHASLFNFLEDKDCEVFHAPYDVELRREDLEGTKIVVPDISVICDEDGIEENKYVGIPSLIIEIVSPSNQSHDLVHKLNLYMQYGVKEYWIVNPLLSTVQIYRLDEKGQYEQTAVIKETGIIHSDVLKGFTVDAQKIFQ
ncbi:Uma2 family endonuclease [Bacillus sp. T33-2]|uniref:Uma2 family endonuclease n=1 Tax=Bacillus sp. T33-2 TaxID=2054168 RepID=UPI000C76364C|nr:Uma2 family endonuclease [Bacillus sp. T33-2]PLR89083.1 endonuclease [Bacillus sp. T33-2]